MWEYSLYVTCKIRPEFVDFIKKEYLKEFDSWTSDTDNSDDTEQKLPKSYRDLIEIARHLKIKYYYHYTFNDVATDNTFNCHIKKKSATSREDLEEFARDVLVPITTEISRCVIVNEDYDIRHNYTDLELRGKSLHLPQIIKSIKHVYDGEDIVQTMVTYKRSIAPLYFADLNKLYGRSTTTLYQEELDILYPQSYY